MSTLAKTKVARGWLMGLILLLACAAMMPRASSALSCNGNVEVDYVAGPQPAVPGDTIRVRLTLYTGSIDGGSQLTWQHVRFDLACDVSGAGGIPCTPESPSTVVRYQDNVFANPRCVDANGAQVTFTANSSAGSFTPNEVVFTPNLPFVLPADTALADGCEIEFDVQVASYSNDATPYQIEEYGGFRTVAGVPDATCDNTLTSSQSGPGSIALQAPTPTNTPLVPVATPTPTGTPGICKGGLGGLIPGYCHPDELNDCLAEICSWAVPPSGINVFHPPNTLTCRDGDPNCDFGPAGDGICTFKLSLCFNVTDTRFMCNSPDFMTRVLLTHPPESHPQSSIDIAVRDAFEAAILSLPGAGISTTPFPRSILFSPALTTPDSCSAPMLLDIPLRQTKLGPRSRSYPLRYRAYPDGSQGPRSRDGDIVRLVCTP